MSRYSAAAKEKILRDVRETLRRLDDEDRSHLPASAAPAQRESGVPIASGSPARMQNAGGALPLLSSASMDRWRQEAAEQEARRRRVNEEQEAEHMRQVQQRSEDLDQRLHNAIGTCLGTKGHILHDTLAGLVSEIHKRMAAEIQAAVGELRAEMNTLLAAQKQHDGGDVIDLPQAFWKRDVA
jgi:hypothetical protein